MPTSDSKFDKLLNIMNEMQSTMDILKQDMDDIKSVKQDIQDLKQVASTQEETIKYIQMAKQNLKSEMDMLHKLVAHQDHIIQNLHSKLVDQQKQSMQKNLILSGLVEPKKETDLQLEMAVDDFFQNCMQLEYNITYEMVHRLGKMKKDYDCPVVICLTDPKDVHVILANTGKLKDIHNSKGKPYFIAVQLPESLQEERHSYQCMMQQNKEKAPADQLSLKLQGHTLYVNGKQYK